MCCLLPLFSVNQCLGDGGTEWGAGPSSLAMLVGRHGMLTGNKQRRRRENESKAMHHGSFSKLCCCRSHSFEPVRGEKGLLLFISLSRFILISPLSSKSLHLYLHPLIILLLTLSYSSSLHLCRSSFFSWWPLENLEHLKHLTPWAFLSTCNLLKHREPGTPEASGELGGHGASEEPRTPVLSAAF